MPKEVYDKDPVLLQPYGVQVRFIREEDPTEPDPKKWKILDILIPLTHSQNSELLLHLEDKHQSWERSSYVYIFQNQLAAYQQWFDQLPEAQRKEEEKAIKPFMSLLRECTQLYAPLEALINKRMGMYGELPGDLVGALEDLRAGLINKLGDQFTEDLLKELDNFIEEAKRLINQIPRDPIAIRNLYSLSREQSDLPCLGYFLSQSLFELGDIGRKRLNEITDAAQDRGKFYNRLSNQFETPYHQNRLSDAKSQIERKRSAYGTEFNSNRVSIPLEMLESLTPQPDKFDKDGKPIIYYRSMRRYVNRMDDREEVDAVLRQASAVTLPVAQRCAPTYTDETPSGLDTLAVVGATFAEIIYPSAVRITLTILIGIATFFGRDITVNSSIYIADYTAYWMRRGWAWLTNDPEAKKHADLELEKSNQSRHALYDEMSDFVDGLDKGLAEWHGNHSPVKNRKAARDKVYKTSEMSELDAQLGAHESFFKVLLDRFNGGTFANFMRNTSASLLQTIFITPVDTVISISGHAWKKWTSPNYSEDTYLKYRDKANDKLFKEFKELMETAETMTTPPEELEYPIRWGVRDMEKPHIESFIHFMQSIVVVLGDEIFDSVFRKSPGFATLAFMASCASLGALIAPNAAPALAAFSESFAKATMGKEAGGAGNTTLLMNNMFTAVLQFKTLFVTMEVMKGDIKILKDIFKNPEEVLLAFMVSSASGMLMSLIPPLPANVTSIHFGLGDKSIELPNFYAEGVNLFIHEAVECMHEGTYGATSLEFSFLSIKMGFLIQSLSAGIHKPHQETREIFKAMLGEYKANIFKWIKEGQDINNKPNVDTLKEQFINILIQRGIIDKDQQIAFLNAFRESQEYAEKQTNVATQGLLPQTNAARIPPVPTQIEASREKLMRMFRMVRNMEMSGVEIESSLEKNALYDSLCQSVEEYNQACQDSGYPGLKFDGTEYLDSFYNKYVYRGSNNFLRSLTLLLPPVTVVVYAWRGLQYLTASLYRNAGIPSYALEQKLKKSWAKDKFLITQTLVMFGRLGQSAMRAVTYGIIRPVILAVPVSIATAITIVTSPHRIAYSALSLVAGGLMVLGYAATLNFQGARTAWNGTKAEIADTWNPKSGGVFGTFGLGFLDTYVWNSRVMSNALDFANRMRPYQLTLWAPIRALYAKTISEADTTHANLTEMSDKGMETLKQHEKHILHTPPVQTTKLVIHSEGLIQDYASGRKHVVAAMETLQQEYNQTLASMSIMHVDLTSRYDVLEEADKKDPDFKELTTLGNLIKDFQQNPGKSEIEIKAKLGIMRWDMRRLESIKALIKIYEPQESPKLK